VKCNNFDVVVIGAGPAGYHAAIRAAQLGLKTACIDAALGKDGKPALGGTCLRVGCIPSKALLDSSRQFWNMGHIFDQHGISFEKPAIDVARMVARKDGIVKQFTGGIAALFKANKVSAFYGFGQLQPGNIVKVKQHDGSEVELKGTNVILAAGSDSIELPFAKFDGEHIVDNVGALDLRDRAEAPGRDRRRRDRAGAGQRVEAPGVRSDHPGRPAEFPCRRRRRSGEGRRARVQEAGPGHQAGLQVHRHRGQGRWRAHQLHRRQGRGAGTGGRQAAGGRGPPRGEQGPAGRTAPA
jgi:hypothetical protein